MGASSRRMLNLHTGWRRGPRGSFLIFKLVSVCDFLRNKKSKEFDMTTLAATALVLLFAGYDTTGITLGYAAYLLAIHPDAQDHC